MTGRLPAGTRNPLDKAISHARLAQAEHLDALLEVRDAQRLRLVALRDDLAQIVNGHPEAGGCFELSIGLGEKPRLWLDMASYVLMEPDPRTYRLVQESRNARETICETDNRDEIIQAIVNHMAHRLVARSRETASVAPALEVRRESNSLVVALAWFSGFLVGALGLLIALLLINGSRL